MKRFLVIFVMVASAAVATTAYAGTPPSIPTNISAALLSSQQIYISWSPSVGSSTVDGYYLYRNGAFVASIPGYTYYTDSPGGGVYSYTVASYDVNGNFSAQSNPTPAVSLVGDTTPPTTPTNFTATASTSSIVLTWNPSTDNIGVIGYYISRNGVRIQTTYPIAGSSYTDSGLTSGVMYHYTIIAYDASRNVSDAAAAQATTIYDITPPSVPAGVTATAVSPTEVDLSWQPSTDNIQVDGYTIYRNGVQLATIATTSYQDTNVSPQTNYSYTISAYDEAGNVSQKNIVPGIATTPARDTTPPTAPSYLTATAISPSQAILNWQPSTDNVAVSGYYIYRGGTEIASVTATTTYEDTGLTTSTYYIYDVVAYDSSSNISAPDYQTVTTLASTPVVAPVVPITPIVTPPPVVTTPPPTITTPTTPPSMTFTTNLSYGSTGSIVIALQNFLISQSDLGASYNTGFYGSLTQAAVKKFQCAENIVCSGSPAVTGWGSVGPRTRAALNAF